MGDELMQYFNERPTPKQKRLFKKLSNIDVHPDISTRAGCSIALVTLISYPVAANVRNYIVLPADCFCDEFNDRGEAKLGSIAHPRYKDGMSIANLAKAMQSFRSVNGEPKVPNKHLSVTRTKMEHACAEKVDEFEEILVVHRRKL